MTTDSGVAVGPDRVVAGVTAGPGESLPDVVALDRGDGRPVWGHAIERFETAVTTPPGAIGGAPGISPVGSFESSAVSPGTWATSAGLAVTTPIAGG